MWKASWGLSHWETHDNPTTLKIAADDIKEDFLAKEWIFFLSLRDGTNLPSPQGFSQTRM
jgi:hypothetical protein